MAVLGAPLAAAADDAVPVDASKAIQVR